ncbi:MAG TPA: FAD-dependent oxidoreductase [Solirubrobacteraceae bacterium]|nr:FAD-dependent oxidoreductase [Solirubrobacteraceae bacterium]
MTRVAIVGAGVAGLTSAHALSAGADVLLVDRLPACGGVLPFDHRAIRDLVRSAQRAGVKFALGATGTRWTGEQLLVAAPGAIRWEPADHLVYAGGSRPSTAAELRLAGVARLAGVLPAPVAVHLLEAGVRIGSNVVVVGSGDWARRTLDELAHQRTRAITVTLPNEPAPALAPGSGDRYAGWTPTVVSGKGRVGEVLIEREGATQRILCDALVLGARLRPLRNVDGAIEDNPSTTFIQHIAEHATIDEVEMHARQASQALIKRLVGD